MEAQQHKGNEMTRFIISEVEGGFDVIDTQDRLILDYVKTMEEAERIQAWYVNRNPQPKPAFQYTAEMYGSDSSYSQGAGNGESDEDRTFGL